MLFNTFEYLGFFVLVLSVAWMLFGLLHLRLWFLLGASLYFYASNNGWQTYLILFTTTVDYLICLQLERAQNARYRKGLVLVSLVSNLGLLGWFKYSNFLGDSVTHLAAALGVKLSWVTLHVMLPVGISFYTFEALSYTMDVYRRKIPAERNWNRLAFLVTFFPHLIAGPIVRAADFFPQLGRRPRLDRAGLESALYLVASGLLKKIVLADNLAPFADAAFTNPVGLGAVRTWIGVYAFAFQIFFDFSGYTDIALGCARLLGYQLPENFRRPYAATSITDFWRRWHMSLSTWLRDYLYVSLGGNRMPTRLGVYRNLMITMLLGGLWHGAAWTFAFWGFLHGLYLAFERALGLRTTEEGDRESPLRSLVRRIIVFQLVTFTWIPFRAKNIHEMRLVLGEMFSTAPGPALNNGAIMAALAMAAAWSWQLAEEHVPLGGWAQRIPLPVKALAYSAIGIAVLVLGSEAPKTFIYFRF